jgi:hypothetical protein
MILSAWHFSNDVEKQRRWNAMIAWAERNECTYILDDIADDDFHVVRELTSYKIGPMGDPLYLPWTGDAKERPSPAELAEHLECLRAQWPTIVDEKIEQVTQPSSFTGCKARRLLVDVTGDASPPWRDWTSLSRVEEERRTFTRFRAAINELIKPHHVDHVDFVIRCP